MMKILVAMALFGAMLFCSEINMQDMQKYEQYKSLLNKGDSTAQQISKDVKIQQPLNEIEAQEKTQDIQDAKTKEKNLFKYAYENQKLQRYGENFFSNKNLANPSIIPSSNNYMLNSGDTLFVSTYETRDSKTYELKIDNNGNIHVPNLGQLKVASLTLAEAKTVISNFIIKSFPNTKVIVDIIGYSSIQIVVTGNVKIPGIYNISSFSTIKDALIAANGLLEVGSYRDIEVVRGGRVVHKFDLYRLLSQTTQSNDMLLQNSDIISVKFTQKNISLIGKVKHAAIYELKNAESFNDLMRYSGGFSFDATKNSIKLTRYDKDKNLKTYLLNKNDFFALTPQDGDKIEVFNNYEIKEKPYIYVHGKVVKKDSYKYTYFDGITIKQLYDMVAFRSEIVKETEKETLDDIEKKQENVKIKKSQINDNEEALDLIEKKKGDVKTEVKEHETDPNEVQREALFVDKNNIKVTRNNDDKKRVFLVSIKDDFVLEPFDDVEFFNYFDTNPRMSATIKGEVYSGGVLFIDNDTTLFDLVKLAGGFTKRAYKKELEIIRYKVADNVRQREILKVDFDDALKQNFKINDGDDISVFTIPKWYDTKKVTLKGEVKFPGTYIISSGEKLSSVIQRAGGFTEHAFIEGAIFTRESVRLNQIEQYNDSLSKIKRSLAIYNAMPANAKRTPTMQNSSSSLNEVILEAQKYQPIGRVSIALSHDIQEIQNSPYNITLQDKDTLSIPSNIDTVTVFGEVFSPNSFIYDSSKTVEDYIEQASGFTNSADEKKVYVIRADGTSVKVSTSWLAMSENKIKRGDTIVVPLYIKEFNSIEVADSISRVFSSLALTAAALNSLGMF